MKEVNSGTKHYRQNLTEQCSSAACATVGELRKINASGVRNLFGTYHIKYVT